MQILFKYLIYIIVLSIIYFGYKYIELNEKYYNLKNENAILKKQIQDYKFNDKILKILERSKNIKKKDINLSIGSHSIEL